MFLRGELEQASTPPETAEASGNAPSSNSAPTAPAWGARAAAPPAGTTSLKAILDQEAATTQSAPHQGSASKQPTPGGLRLTPGSGVKSRPALQSPGGGSAPLRLSLASFMASSPMAAAPRPGAASPPPLAWGGAAGSSPPAARQTSLRKIQEEQEALAPARPVLGSSSPLVGRLGSGLPPWRPPSATPAGAAASLLGTSPSASTSLLGTSPSGSSFMAAPVPQHSKW